MGEIRGIVPHSLEKEFRKHAMKKFGYGKGSLRKALEASICLWVKNNETG